MRTEWEIKDQIEYGKRLVAMCSKSPTGKNNAAHFEIFKKVVSITRNTTIECVKKNLSKYFPKKDRYYALLFLNWLEGGN